MAETWAVNGTDLRSLAWRIEKGDGLVGTPELRDQDLEIPGRHGVLAAARQQYGAGQLVLNMWVKGVDPTTGLVPGGSSDVDEYYKRVDTLAKLFTASTLTVVHTRSDGTARQAVGHLTDTLDFTREISSPLFGRFSAAIRITGAFWSDTADQTQTVTLSSGGTGSLTSFAAATAPMDDLTVTFGPASNPAITQTATGVLLAYDAVISSGRQLTVNADTLALGIGAGSSWTPDMTKLRFAGSRGFELRPQPSGIIVQLSHTGGGTAAVTFTGKRKYLTP